MMSECLREPPFPDGTLDPIDHEAVEVSSVLLTIASQSGWETR
jgi:hypothetical protein